MLKLIMVFPLREFRKVYRNPFSIGFIWTNLPTIVLWNGKSSTAYFASPFDVILLCWKYAIAKITMELKGFAKTWLVPIWALFFSVGKFAKWWRICCIAAWGTSAALGCARVLLVHFQTHDPNLFVFEDYLQLLAKLSNRTFELLKECRKIRQL